MKKTFTALALGLGLIAGLATQARAVIVDGDPYDLVTIKATLKVASGLKVQTVSFTNKDLLAFAQAPKGSKLGCEMSEYVEDLDSQMYILTKDDGAYELDSYYSAGDVYAYVYVDDYDYDYYTVTKDTDKAYAYKTDGYIGWGAYLYTGDDESDYTYLEFYSDTHSAKLTQSNSYGKTSSTYSQSISDTGMYLYDSEVVTGGSSSYPYLDGTGSLSISGTAKFTEL